MHLSKSKVSRARRKFLVGTACAGMAALGPYVHAAKQKPRIRSLARREDTVLRCGGHGDNFHMSWGADDRQWVAVCDGLGWTKNPAIYYNSRLFSIAGGPTDAVFHEVSNYPDLPGIPTTEHYNRYYGFGTLSVGGRIYQFLSTPNHRFLDSNGVPLAGAKFIGAKLIHSPDNGLSWRNQDGSSVVWEEWRDRSRQNMVFFEESQDAFSLISLLQMGRDYTDNADGYVYAYAPNGNVDGAMNQLVMFRCPKLRMLDRSAYEYFGGLQRGLAKWVKNLDDRAVVHTFPKGWVNTSAHPWAWMPSVSYNRTLKLYMMASWGTGCTDTGEWFGKPSYLGFWIASQPWGPWTQVHEETAWTPQGDQNARAFAPQISPKWIAEDGKSFWLVWSDYQSIASVSDKARLKEERLKVRSHEDSVRYFQHNAKLQPHYSFNAQRVDLATT